MGGKDLHVTFMVVCREKQRRDDTSFSDTTMFDRTHVFSPPLDVCEVKPGTMKKNLAYGVSTTVSKITSGWMGQIV